MIHKHIMDISMIMKENFNLKVLLFLDLLLLAFFFAIIFRQIFTIFKNKKSGKLGSETSFKYLTFFSVVTLLPSILIAIFSLILFNVGIQKYFDKKIKTAVNNSTEVARNYLEESKSSIESDILLMLLDVNNMSNVFYSNPKRFKNILSLTIKGITRPI